MFYLEIPLSEAFFGAKKIIQIKRDKIMERGNIIKEVKYLELIIKKDCLDGCKILYRGLSDECIGF